MYKGSGRGRLGAPRPPWRVRVECEEVFVLELSGTTNCILLILHTKWPTSGPPASVESERRFILCFG